MTPEQISAQRIVSYVPPYLKDKVIEYVNKHDDETISQFTEDALRDRLIKVGALQPNIKPNKYSY